MSEYAKGTSVPADRSRTEIERTLVRFGADQFMYGWEGSRALIQFRAEGKVIRFVLPLPDQDDPRFTHTPAQRKRRTHEATIHEWEKATRQAWRALAMIVKAKLVAVEDGITEFESEFLAHIVLPDGSTVGGWILPQIEHVYATEEMPLALPTGITEEAK